MVSRELYLNRSRLRIIEKVTNYPIELLPERMEELNQHIDMLGKEWYAATGEENKQKRDHLLECIKVSVFESSQIEKRLNKSDG